MDETRSPTVIPYYIDYPADPDCEECRGSGRARMCTEPDCEFFYETIRCPCTMDSEPDPR